MHGRRRGDLGEAGGHELQQRHLGGGVLHGDAVGVEVGVALAAHEVLALRVEEVVQEDLLGEREWPAEALAADGGPLGKRGVDALDELDGGGGADGGHVIPLCGGDGVACIRLDVYNSNTSERVRQTLRYADPGTAWSGAGERAGDALTRRIRYQEIAAELRALATSSPAGSLLPSESELSARFGASRVTVRRALEVVRDEGLVAARQGFGWFVAAEPVRQTLQHLGTIEDQLEGGGRHAERRVVEFAFTTAPARVERVLGVEHVLRVKRLNLADGEPFAVVTVWCPAELGRSLSREDVERRPFYEVLGVALRGATQTIGADSAEADDAALLHVPVGAPVLRCQRVTTDTAGRPILMSDHVYPAHRTEFVVELPLAEPSTTPAGLRLVEGA